MENICWERCGSSLADWEKRGCGEREGAVATVVGSPLGLNDVDSGGVRDVADAWSIFVSSSDEDVTVSRSFDALSAESKSKSKSTSPFRDRLDAARAGRSIRAMSEVRSVCTQVTERRDEHQRRTQRTFDGPDPDSTLLPQALFPSFRCRPPPLGPPLASIAERSDDAHDHEDGADADDREESLGLERDRDHSYAYASVSVLHSMQARRIVPRRSRRWEREWTREGKLEGGE